MLYSFFIFPDPETASKSLKYSWEIEVGHTLPSLPGWCFCLSGPCIAESRSKAIGLPQLWTDPVGMFWLYTGQPPHKQKVTACGDVSSHRAAVNSGFEGCVQTERWEDSVFSSESRILQAGWVPVFLEGKGGRWLPEAESSGGSWPATGRLQIGITKFSMVQLVGSHFSARSLWKVLPACWPSPHPSLLLVQICFGSKEKRRRNKIS